MKVTDIIMDEIRRKEFYQAIKTYSLDLNKIFVSIENKSKIDVKTDYKEEFNLTLRDLKKNFDFDIIEAVLFLERDWANMKSIFLILDEESKYTMKVELSKKYCIKITKTTLDRFLEWD